ncbi:hypothetical protein BLA6863_04957 [Burkholderia lata]|uniref:Uncharacterized protein n=1 Tax=Burkholderia lata (strain ATCC 17760 / DSM 23089 / LMG 22485 / NCIMB 9086 / R18194 / 383) TaxID=482957 RepID=A0A6P2P8E1_BURL3|nr:hypothetical protein BLA6863_04957 [Burkholderia lata]
MKCTALRLVGGVGCPQCRALLADLARALTVRLHSVSSGLGRDVHIVAGMRLALASTFTVRIHSAASGFQPRISTLTRTYCFDRWLAFSARILGGAGGFVGWAGVPEHARRAIADSHSSWKYTGSQAGWSAGQARRNPHAAQSRARAHCGHTPGRERVGRPDWHAGTRMLRNRGLGLTVETHWVANALLGRTGTPVHACYAFAGLGSFLKHTGS